MKIAVVLSLIPLFFIFGCTVDQGEGNFDVDAEITDIGTTIISVKYKIGKTIVYDDITMKENAGILSAIKNEKPKTIPLGVSITFYSTEDGSSEKSSFKYYYGANFLTDSKSFDLDSIIRMAKANPDLFKWTYRDGVDVRNVKKKETKEMEESSEPQPGTLDTEEASEKL